jgi:hypothetical protein
LANLAVATLVILAAWAGVWAAAGDAQAGKEPVPGGPALVGWQPTVQVIDNFARNHELGQLFETKVGKGELLVCAIDFLGLPDEPEARQFLSSLLGYAGSKDFDPEAEPDVAG